MNKTLIVVIGVMLTSRAAVAASIPAACEAAKQQEAGALRQCLHKAEQKLVTSGDPGTYGAAVDKCTGKFSAKWQLAEEKAIAKGGSCPSVADASNVESSITANVAYVTTALDTGDTTRLGCGNGVVDPGEDCDLGPSFGGATCASASGGTLRHRYARLRHRLRARHERLQALSRAARGRLLLAVRCDRTLLRRHLRRVRPRVRPGDRVLRRRERQQCKVCHGARRARRAPEHYREQWTARRRLLVRRERRGRFRDIRTTTSGTHYTSVRARARAGDGSRRRRWARARSTRSPRGPRLRHPRSARTRRACCRSGVSTPSLASGDCRAGRRRRAPRDLRRSRPCSCRKSGSAVRAVGAAAARDRG